MQQQEPKYRRRPFPANTLEESIKLAQAIQDQNNGRPMNRVLLANAIGKRPASSDYKLLLSSAVKYGLTTGNEKSDTIALTESGVAITRPRNALERAAEVKKAALQPQVFRQIFQHYNNGKLPQSTFFLTVLERDFRVPRDRCQECADTVLQNGRFAGVVREQQGSLYVVLAPEGELAEPEEPAAEATPTERPAAPSTPPPPPPSERFIFVAHGKNLTPLEQLKKVLDQFKIRYKVAIDEPQKARPISLKVAETMQSCQSAIFIFSADEEFTNAEGQTVWRPSQNVIYELGAASVLYGDKIVIFKEQGLDFPTDFRDIGNIPFEKDALDARGVQLIAELIALGLVAVQPT